MSRSSTSSSDSRALARRIALLISPLFALLTSYIAMDPFRVVWKHERFYAEPTPVSLNRDFVSTEMFLNAHAEERWDSYIFGSSRSLAYLTETWQQYLPPESKAYHFDAAGESLYGVHGKVQLIARLRAPLRHALCVVDASLLANVTERAMQMQIKHPSISGQSRLDFQAHFLRAYFYDFFAVKFLHYRLSGTLRPYMTDVLDPRLLTYTWPGNDTLFASAEHEIARDGAAAYAERRAKMFKRNAPVAGALVIDSLQREMLASLASVFRDKGTSVRVVVSPLYDQRRIHEQDLATLREYFGASEVVDYSGVNSFTSDRLNYYDESHYKVAVASEILASVYRGTVGRN